MNKEPGQIIEIVVGPPPERATKAAPEQEALSGRLAPGGGVTACVCPECGYEEPHSTGEPCSGQECPECGAAMTGKVGEKAIDGEKPPDPPVLPEKPGVGAGVLQAIKGALDGVFAQVKDLFQDRPDSASGAPDAGDHSLEDGLATAFKTFVGPGGQTWLLTWTTNAFEDREEEIFSTKSLEEYVARHEDDAVKGEYWFWHIPGTRFGEIRWQGVSGRFLVEAGPFDDTPAGQAFKAFFSAFPDGHETVAPLGWGTSHGYVYRRPDRMDGVYEWFDKKETTVLPSHAAANAYTSMEVLEMALTPKQKQALEAIGGQELVALVEQKGERMTKELEDAGVAYKGDRGDDDAAPEGDLEIVPEGGFAGHIAQVAAQIDDPDTARALKQIVAELKAKGADADEEEEEEEEGAEPEEEEGAEPEEEEEKEEEEEEEGESSKATWTTAYMNDLPDSAFLYVQPGGEKDSEGKTTPRGYRHLPYRDKDGGIDLPHLQNSISRLSQEGTGETEQAGDWLSEDLRKSLLAKARALLEEKSKGLTRFAVLAQRLGGIAQTVDGQKGLYLGAIADAMQQVAEAGASLEHDEKQAEPPETGQSDMAAPREGEETEEMDMKQIVETITEALQLGALSETIQGLHQQVADLGAQIKALQEERADLAARLAETERADEERLAEKELGIPRFSWFRASSAAETVIDQHTADAQKAIRGAARAPGAINALAAAMGRPEG